MGTWRILLIVPVALTLFAGGSKTGTAQAGPDQASDQHKDKNLAAGEREAKQLLLLMDRNQNGKVSKQEFMSFMEAEFNRLDKNNDGQLDVNELTQARVVTRPGIHR